MGLSTRFYGILWRMIADEGIIPFGLRLFAGKKEFRSDLRKMVGVSTNRFSKFIGPSGFLWFEILVPFVMPVFLVVRHLLAGNWVGIQIFAVARAQFETLTDFWSS